MCDGTGSNGHPGRVAVGAGGPCPLAVGAWAWGVRRVLGWGAGWGPTALWRSTRIAFGRFGDLQSGCSADGFPSLANGAIGSRAGSRKDGPSHLSPTRSRERQQEASGVALAINRDVRSPVARQVRGRRRSRCRALSFFSEALLLGSPRERKTRLPVPPCRPALLAPPPAPPMAYVANCD